MSNYTDKMLSQMRKASPINYDKAAALASDFGLPTRSIIAKAVQMDDVVYIPKARAIKQNGTTKAQLIASIRKVLAMPAKSGDLSKDDLATVLDNVAKAS